MDKYSMEKFCCCIIRYLVLKTYIVSYTTYVFFSKTIVVSGHFTHGTMLSKYCMLLYNIA